MSFILPSTGSTNEDSSNMTEKMLTFSRQTKASYLLFAPTLSILVFFYFLRFSTHFGHRHMLVVSERQKELDI